MKTWKTIVAVLITMDMATCPLIIGMPIGCQNQAASTAYGPVCDFLCTEACNGKWTTDTALWCKPATGFNCDTYSFNPPVNVIVNSQLGTCTPAENTCPCHCDFPPRADLELTFWYQGTSVCPQ
jgi:hypothetical protein